MLAFDGFENFIRIQWIQKLIDWTRVVALFVLFIALNRFVFDGFEMFAFDGFEYEFLFDGFESSLIVFESLLPLLGLSNIVRDPRKSIQLKAALMPQSKEHSR